MYDIIPRNAYTFPANYVIAKHTRTQIITYYVTCNTVSYYILFVGVILFCVLYITAYNTFTERCIPYEMCMCPVMGHPVCAHHGNASRIASMSTVYCQLHTNHMYVMPPWACVRQPILG